MSDHLDQSTRRQLVALRDRYFRPTISFPGGIVVHHGDCQIRRSVEIHGHATCTCGLLHDLRPLPGDLGGKVYPLLPLDDARQELGPRFEAASRRPPGEVPDFPGLVFVEEPAGDFEARERDEWSVIALVFGQDTREEMERNWRRVGGQDFWEGSLT